MPRFIIPLAAPALLVAGWAIFSQTRSAAESASAASRPARRGSVTRSDLEKHYDLSDPQVDLSKFVVPGVPKDGIPALTDPARTSVKTATYPRPQGRVAVVSIKGQTVAYPLGILNFHEIANDVVGETPIAVTYCPLCDSVAVVDRRLTTQDQAGKSQTRTLEFGVSGFLLNSNVVMYERGTKGLWSQVYAQAITGPDGGRSLRHLPVVMMSFAHYRKLYPEGSVLTTKTGHRRPYDRNPYERYLEPDRICRDLDFGFDKRLEPKTLGMGVKSGETLVFVTARRARQAAVTIKTARGEIVIGASEQGMRLERAPREAQTLQTFYHSWSAFHPKTTIIDVAQAEPK